MHIHILGICGTFMGSLALLARDLGYKVTGSDANVYPPMSTQLEKADIHIMQGYSATHLGADDNFLKPDLVVVGNTMKRGIEAVEYMLNQRIPYTSGPQFLAEEVLKSRHVLAVAGTHGKTTTTTMLAWILQYNGIDTGFLIGGVPIVSELDKENNNDLARVFAHSSHLGHDYFVIEADEYDSAFFDKRSKFVHYRPKTAILNNLEFDHADIFSNLEAIQTQFHHMIRMIPSEGRIIMPGCNQNLEETIDKGCWTPIWRTETVKDFYDDDSQSWQVKLLKEDGSKFSIKYQNNNEEEIGQVIWNMSGLHNIHNGMVAVAAAVDIGISMEKACEALSNFSGIKRRMELIGTPRGIQVYDDFAHHPTAIRTTLDGVKKKLPNKKMWAIIEPRSNTMKMGIHQATLAKSSEIADQVLWYEPAGLEWGLADNISNSQVSNTQKVFDSVEKIIEYTSNNIESNDIVIIMSNGGFDNIHRRLINALNKT